jgi:hypothetical protein
LVLRATIFFVINGWESWSKILWETDALPHGVIEKRLKIDVDGNSSR